MYHPPPRMPLTNAAHVRKFEGWILIAIAPEMMPLVKTIISKEASRLIW